MKPKFHLPFNFVTARRYTDYQRNDLHTGLAGAAEFPGIGGINVFGGHEQLSPMNLLWRLMKIPRSKEAFAFTRRIFVYCDIRQRSGRIAMRPYRRQSCLFNLELGTWNRFSVRLSGVSAFRRSGVPAFRHLTRSQR